MNAVDLLGEVERAGGALVLEGEALKVRAPAPLPPEMVTRLKEARADLLDELRRRGGHTSARSHGGLPAGSLLSVPRGPFLEKRLPSDKRTPRGVGKANLFNLPSSPLPLARGGTARTRIAPTNNDVGTHFDRDRPDSATNAALAQENTVPARQRGLGRQDKPERPVPGSYRPKLEPRMYSS